MLEDVLYNGQFVSKQHFRVFLFNKEGKKILVNSWDEYQSLITGGDWYDEVPPPIEKENPTKNKKTRRRGNVVNACASGVTIVEEVDEMFQEITLV